MCLVPHGSALLATDRGRTTIADRPPGWPGAVDRSPRLSPNVTCRLSRSYVLRGSPRSPEFNPSKNITLQPNSLFTLTKCLLRHNVVGHSMHALSSRTCSAVRGLQSQKITSCQVCIRLGEGDMLTPVVFTSDLSSANRFAALSHVVGLFQGQDPFEVSDPPFGFERSSG